MVTSDAATPEAYLDALPAATDAWFRDRWAATGKKLDPRPPAGVSRLRACATP